MQNDSRHLAVCTSVLALTVLAHVSKEPWPNKSDAVKTWELFNRYAREFKVLRYQSNIVKATRLLPRCTHYAGLFTVVL